MYAIMVLFHNRETVVFNASKCGNEKKPFKMCEVTFLNLDISNNFRNKNLSN